MLHRLREWRESRKQLREDAKGVAIEPLGPNTVEYLSDLASESYKRQADLDESVWRSLPFFAATFAFVATLVGRTASDLPAWTGSFYSWWTHGLLLAAVGCMIWVLRWFWTVLRPRDYEFPAADAAVRVYAEQIGLYHSARGLRGTALDDKVVLEVRMFMIEQLGSGATTNLGHNAVKLKARSKVLLFMLIGFVLAFAGEATIFIHDRAYGAPKMLRGDEVAGTPEAAGAERQGSSSPTEAAQGAAGHGGGAHLGGKLQGPGQEQSMSRKPTTSSGQKPLAGPGTNRPTPPTAQIVTKAGRELGSTHPTGKPSSRPTTPKPER